MVKDDRRTSTEEASGEVEGELFSAGEEVFESGNDLPSGTEVASASWSELKPPPSKDDHPSLPNCKSSTPPT